MIEMDKKVCKRCGRLRNRILAGKFPNSKNKKFEDDDGLLWNGHKCGSCHQIEMREKMKLKRTRD